MDSESKTGVSNQGEPGKIRNYADLRNVKPGLQCTARGFPVLSTMGLEPTRDDICWWMWWVHRWIVYLKTDQVVGLIGIPFLTTIGHSGSIPYFAGFSPTFACLKPLAGPSSCVLQVTRSTTSFGQRTPIGTWQTLCPYRPPDGQIFRRRNAESWTDLGPGMENLMLSPMASQDLMYDALILAKQRVTNSAPDWGRPQQSWKREKEQKRASRG